MKCKKISITRVLFCYILSLILEGCNPLGGGQSKVDTTFNPGGETIKVTSILPVTGAITGGTRLTITGKEFQNGAVVEIDSENCPSVLFISSTTLECTLPSHSIGSASVTVINPGGATSTLESSFTYISAVTATAGYAITIGGGISSDVDGQLHANIGEDVSGGPILTNVEARLVSGLTGATLEN
ncbi:MAG: IPT/TIG domain-containing protein [Bacteriovoracaceae bacterium]